MKILVLCDQGNNRSVTVAHHLKYWGHDCIPAGLKTNSPETLKMLCNWADRIICTDVDQGMALGLNVPGFSVDDGLKLQLWNIGPDIYKRPFNPELLAKVRGMMEEHKAEYKSTA